MSHRLVLQNDRFLSGCWRLWIVLYCRPRAGQNPTVDGRPLFFGLTDERNTLRLPDYSRLDIRGDRVFNWSGRRLVLFGEVANVLSHTNVRNASYFVDRAGRVFETTETLMPIVPSAGFVIEF